MFFLLTTQSPLYQPVPGESDGADTDLVLLHRKSLHDVNGELLGSPPVLLPDTGRTVQQEGHVSLAALVLCTEWGQ